ncbi:FtsQ-type POTRA domain-containing protein [Bacillus sp. IB182487]|uniref:Cell division protein DivIB n=2 Tax=Metabacillus arenae TaxID=2771434 RepID=A0A926NFM6_9BACI|nr:FtsQ-type POTRA domain-containing protein [Metabacillus arenae]
MFLSLFFMLILLVIYFQSPLSKVGKVKVEGNIYFTAEKIKDVSGITTNTGYWNIQNDEVIEKIKSIGGIKDVHIEKKLPNNIAIIVKEYNRVAYVKKKGQFYPVLENGNSMESAQAELPINAPIMYNWNSEEHLKEMTAQLSELPLHILGMISEIYYTPKKNDPWHVTLYMNDGYEVSATVRDFAEKMSNYPSIVSQLDPSVKGIIHLEVGTYFEAYKTKEKEGEKKENETEG